MNINIYTLVQRNTFKNESPYGRDDKQLKSV